MDLHLYSTFLVSRPLKVLYHSHTDGKAFGNNFGVQYFAQGLEEPGIEPPIFWLVLSPEPQLALVVC